MKISDEAVEAARTAALARWYTGSADTTQMLLSVFAGIKATLPYLERSDSEELPAPSAMPDQEALAMALQEHHPTTGMAVTSGVTCQCGYWNGNERPGVDRPAGAQGRDGLDWHRAQVVLALLGLEVPSDQPCLGDGVRDRKVAEPPRGCLGDGVCTNPKCPVHGIKEEPRDQPN